MTYPLKHPPIPIDTLLLHPLPHPLIPTTTHHLTPSPLLGPPLPGASKDSADAMTDEAQGQANPNPFAFNSLSKMMASQEAWRKNPCPAAIDFSTINRWLDGVIHTFTHLYHSLLSQAYTHTHFCHSLSSQLIIPPHTHPFAHICSPPSHSSLTPINTPVTMPPGSLANRPSHPMTPPLTHTPLPFSPHHLSYPLTPSLSSHTLTPPSHSPITPTTSNDASWLLLLTAEDEFARARSTQFLRVHPTANGAEHYVGLYRNYRFSDHLLSR